MLPGKSQGATRPTAMGSLLQASTYGQTIPTIYGMTQSPLLAIWAANLRQGGSVKKFKQYKKGITAYVENIDFLLGHNPIMGVMRMWNNSSPIPLNFTSQSFSAAGGRASFVVTDANFYAVVGVTLTQSYSVSFNDYGGAPQALSGTYEVPLWNELETGPDPTDPMSYRCWPFSYRWQPTFGTTVNIDAESFPAGTLKIYYAQLNSGTSGHTPLAFERLSFETELGSGTEYADAGNIPGGSTPYTSQQIVYPMFAGCGSSEIDLGSGGVIPQLQAEIKGKWGVYSTGDGDFADMIEDVFKSGLAQAAIGSATANSQVEHGLSSYSYPGTIQKKTDSHATVALPPMLYDMPNTPGNILVAVCASTGTLGISSSAGDTWTPIFSAAVGYQVWYATAVGGQNTVTISGSATPWEMTIYEIGGVGEIDTATFVSNTPPTGNASGSATMVYGVELVQAPCSPSASIFFSDFQLIAPLASDAVIQGIYPVLVGTTSGGGTFSAGYGEGFEPVPLGFSGDFNQGFSFPGSGSTSGEYYGPSIGTSLSALAGQMIGACCANTAEDDPVGTVAVGAVGYAVYYTTASPPGGAAPIPPPFAIPSGQAIGWALPNGAGAYGPDLYYPFLVIADPDYIIYKHNGNAEVSLPSGATATVGPGTTGSSPTPPTRPGLVTISTGSPGAISSTVTQGQPGFLMSLPWYSAGAPANMEVPSWDLLSAPNFYSKTSQQIQAHGQVIYSPGTYALTEPGTPTQQALLSFKSANPPAYPRPLGDFIDLPSLDMVRAQCRANGLWGSLSMNSQQNASDWLKTLYQAANAAPAFIGFKLYSFPYSEASAVGNGSIYEAPTAGGPIYNLSTENGDFVTQGSEPPIQIQTAARVNQPNVLQMQCINRNSNYNPSVVEQPDAVGISLFGVRKADPIVNNAIQDVSVARQLLGIQVRKLQYGGDVYTFSLPVKWCLLAPMDLITITDPLADINQIPVRLTSIEEQNDGSLACTAEPFVYGMYSPATIVTDVPAPFQPTVGNSAGDVNAPVIFEPTPRLVNLQNEGQLWLAVSCANPNYGGCQVYISTDGGSSYNPAGNPLIGSAITGVSTADWPAASDPDTTNNLSLDLTESNGTLLSYQTTDENNFLYPCYIAGGGDPIPYELMTYAVATLTAAYKYTLMATGTGNQLRRGVYAAPVLGVGVDHPSGSRWAFLSPSGTGILKLNMDPAWVGKTLYFKCCSFNTFGGAQQSLSDVVAYPYTVLGTSGTGPQLFQVNGA